MTPERFPAPDTMTPTPQRLRLDNGLDVAMLSMPKATRTAAVIRVAAGSHDEPRHFPGLAHFLEHLLFLGGAEFSGEQRLMPFIHRQGGQLNASTRERDTWFFFELPAGEAEAGLARLCDMLCHPAFDASSLQREREILQAEYLLWMRDTDTRCDSALAQALPADHPQLRFHAGNRDSLKVEQPAFRQALQEFHQRFYQAGQMQLVLSGPQPFDTLRALAERHGRRFRAASPTPRPLPPTLLPIAAHRLHLHTENGLPRISLFFILDALPAGTDEAIDFLTTWLQQPCPGGLLDQLRQHDDIETLRLRVPYRYAGQAILVVDFFLDAPDKISTPATDHIVRAFLDWRRFFVAQDDWQPLRDEYKRLVTRRLSGMSPLALARYWSERLPRDTIAEAHPAPGLSASGLVALRVLLAQLCPQQLVTMHACPATPGSTARGVQIDTHDAVQASDTMPGPWQWRLPPPNPFLRDEPPAPVPAGSHHARSSALRWCDALPADTGQGALFLRWQFPTSPVFKRLGHALGAALAPLVEQARQAGVDARFDPSDDQWLLSMMGQPGTLPAVLHGALVTMMTPPASAWTGGLRLARNERRSASGELLIRQLLAQLPEAVKEACAPPEPGMATMSLPSADNWTERLQQAWRLSRRDGLALGLPERCKADIHALLAHMPGRPVASALTVPALRHRFRWQHVRIEQPECGLLLFCPLPGQDIRHEAHWRLLAQHYQNAFYQRLRTELQLGYAVFCGFRYAGNQAGILFAVQSPHASAGEILSHIEAFLAERRMSIAALSDEDIHQRGMALGEQLGTGASGFRPAAEQLWHTHTAGRLDKANTFMTTMRHMLQGATARQLLSSHDDLQQAAAGWLCLANTDSPDPRWS